MKQKFEEVQALGQRPDKGHSKVNTERLAPGAFRKVEGNFTNHAEGTLHMAICTCLPQMVSEKKNKKGKGCTDFMASTNSMYP